MLGRSESAGSCVKLCPARAAGALKLAGTGVPAFRANGLPNGKSAGKARIVASGREAMGAGAGETSADRGAAAAGAVG